MKYTFAILFLLLAFVVVIPPLFTVVDAQSPPGIVRIQGADRYETAVQVSRVHYPNGADTVYIANGDSMVDALSAGPSINGPILLVGRSLPHSTQQELRRLQPSNIVILGGTAAVSREVQNQIEQSFSNSQASGGEPEDLLTTLINQERNSALARASDIDSVSEAWAQRMADERRAYHNPDYSNQICCWRRLSENVGWTTISSTGIDGAVQRMHDTFMQSDGHRQNILDPEVGELGVGVVVGGCPDGVSRPECLWVTENFRG